MDEKKIERISNLDGTIYYLKWTLGQVYIGSTTNWPGRISGHRSSYKRWKDGLTNSKLGWYDYGDDFKYGVIEHCDTSDMSNREEFWINHPNFKGKIVNVNLVHDKLTRFVKYEMKDVFRQLRIYKISSLWNQEINLKPSHVKNHTPSKFLPFIDDNISINELENYFSRENLEKEMEKLNNIRESCIIQ